MVLVVETWRSKRQAESTECPRWATTSHRTEYKQNVAEGLRLVVHQAVCPPETRILQHKVSRR
jgi:hypothetical protein